MTALVRPPASAREETRQRRQPMSMVARYGLALILLQAILRTWFLSRSWFYFDDLAFMSAGMNNHLSWAFLGRNYAGHLMPAGWLVIKALATWAPYGWGTWATLLVVLQAIASYGMLRLLRSMFGDHPAVLALLAGYLFYIFTVPAGVWFAAGINQLPLQIALVFGLHAHLDYLRTRRVRSLVLTLVWTAFGLLFYEKSVILFGLYALIALCWFAQGTLVQRAGSLWKRYRWGVVAHAAIALPYLLIYLKYGLDLGSHSTPGSLVSAVAYRLVAVALSTGVIGGPFEWTPMSANAIANPSDLICLGSWVAIGGLVYYAFRTRTLSRRAWWLIAFTTSANVYLLSSARASLVGPDIALEYRYQTEAAAIVILSIGLAFLPLRGAVEVNEPREGVARPQEQTLQIRLLTVAVVAASLVSTLAYVQNWQHSNPTQPYFDNVKAGLTTAPVKPVPLVDQSLPQNLLWAFGYPENTYSHVFRHLGVRTSYPDSSLDQLYLFDGLGRLTPAQIPPVRTMVPGNGCGYVLGARPTTIPLTGPVIGGGWWIRLGYAGPRPFKATIRLGDQAQQLSFPAGAHTLYFKADGSYDSVVVDNARAGRTACVTELTLGAPATTPALP